MQNDTTTSRRAPARTGSRKRAVRMSTPQQQVDPRARLNAYHALKKSPALKQARITRMKRLNAAQWAAAQAQIPIQWKAMLVVLRVLIMSLVIFVIFKVMIQEKQLMKLKNILTRRQSSYSMQKTSWRSFTRSYEARFRRPTPPVLESWLTFAQDNDCDTFKLYQAIERDLLPFRRHIPHDGPLLRWDQLQAMAINYTQGAYLLVQIKDHQLTIVDEQLEDWFQQHPTVHHANSIRGWWEVKKLKWNLAWLLDPLLQHKPPLAVRLVINLHARPKSPKNAVVPIFSSHSEHYHTNNDATHPGNLSLEIANKNRNGVIDTRDVTTRDLLIPHLYIAGGRMGATGMTSSPAIGGFWFWPFFREGVPWQQRRNTIVWRGSTLGNFDNTSADSNDKNNSNKTHDFFSGPRFTMMQKWGGTSVHPVQAESQVQVDFAFTSVVLQGEEHMTKAQKAAIIQAVKKEYRFARRLSFRQLQKHKYLMDVDGNAFSVRFSALMRSGSLIFKATRYREWFSERIRSWKDYIPVNYDTSDLAHKLEWANAQAPEVITNIIRHGKETVERYIRPEDMQCYTYRLVLEYMTLFDPDSFLVHDNEDKENNKDKDHGDLAATTQTIPPSTR